MNWIVGVDGCPRGWIAVGERDGAITSRIVEAFEALFRAFSPVGIVTVDIPIGLTDRDSRQCDVLARRQLGPRASSVFPAPIRPCLNAATYEEAARISQECQQKSISKQSFAIYRKIREVDVALRSNPDLQKIVYEVHPEVCFQAWNSGVPMRENKKSVEGAAERRRLVDAEFAPTAFQRVRESHARKDATDDDIIDGFAALWIARRIASGTSRTLPSHPPFDSAGLPMRMVF